MLLQIQMPNIDISKISEYIQKLTSMQFESWQVMMIIVLGVVAVVTLKVISEMLKGGFTSD